MEQDILPDLLALIEKEFDQRTFESVKLKKALQALKDKRATYIDVNEFAIEVGEILADVFKLNISAEILPDGKMYFKIADRLLNATLTKNHELITGFGVDVQTELNHAAGMKIKGQAPKINQDRVDGLINKISDAPIFDDVKWLLNEPIVNFSQSIVDTMIKENVEFHAKSGFQPKLRRRVDGSKACEWCQNLAGVYDYPDVPDDIYRRHKRCKCTVEYNPKDSRGIQNSHSKVWSDPAKDDKIEARKEIGLKELEKSNTEYLESRLDFIDPITREKGFIPSGTIFENTRTIFKGKEIRIVNRLADRYGGRIPNWEKRVGKIESDKFVHDVHWYENSKKQYEAKLKFRREKK